MPRVITFLLNPLYIHYIDKEAFSVFSSLYSWIALVNVMLTFGFETSFFRFSTEKENEKKSFDTSFWFIFGLAAVFLISILIFSAPLSVILDYAKNPEFLRWFAMIAFLDAICVIPFAWLRFHNMPIKYSVIRVASIFVPTSTSKKIGLDGQVSYPFISNLLGSLATFVLLLPIILKVKFRFSKELFSRMIKYSWPIMIAGLAFQVNENYDKITQYYNISKADAGAYGGCYKLAVLMTLFVTAYRMGIEPYFFKQMNNENAKNNYAKVTEYFSFFASIVAMGIIANISWLKVIFITDHSYWTAMDIVPIIVIANLCFGIYYNLSTWYKVTDRTHFGTLISWFGAGLTIVLHFLFLKKYGFMVSAWVTFIAYFLMMVLSYFLGQKYYPIPYRIKKISFFLILLMIFSLISVYIFKYNFWLSNSLFVIYSGILLYSEKEFILSKVKK